MSEFDVDLEHLMEDIVNTYSFEKWKIPIVENVDNFIDEHNYHTISFTIDEGKLEIIMYGAGILEEDFKKLSTIAWTEKIDKQSREKRMDMLGFYGWGLKATMIVAESVEIMTKRDSYQGGQRWYWVGRKPYYNFIQYSSNDLKENHTKLTYYLKDEYKGKISEKGIIETLQEFYPTLLNNAPAKGRKRRFFVNGKVVPPPEWLDERRYKKKELLKNLKNAGGCVFISDNELEENLRGIAIIIHGRMLKQRINPCPDVKRYTSYVHADFLVKLLYGDKTDIKKNNPLYIEFKKELTVELENILKRNGLMPETTSSERELLREIHKIVGKVIADVPELERLVIGQEKIETIYMKGNDTRVTKTYGPSSKTDIPRKDHEENIDQPGGGENKPIIKPSLEGEETAKKTRGARRGMPQFIMADLSLDIEAEVQGTRIAINRKHPLYQFARNDNRNRRYHICRAGLEAILDNSLKEGSIKVEDYLDLKNKVMQMLGEHL
jgi:hypothetical protein